jgi:anion-transporting  ArsA/GET3 family ATPase
MTHSLDDLVEHGHIVICCGTGGVGKTTSAAVLALEGARNGRHAVVVTIDPAKRLANALGLAALSNTPHEIDRALWDGDGEAAPTGRLAAMMLDTKSTFDTLVSRYAETPEQAARILQNRFYRNISGALSGTQEYMAMEKLHELHEDGGYDLIVVDTPPSRHALDFLDAPQRLMRLLDNHVFRLLMMPTRAYLRVASVAVQVFLRTISKVVGTEVVEDVVAFFRAFEGMEQGFRDRAGRVIELLADEGTRFVLVTTPRRDAVQEAEFFAQRLGETGIDVDALIVNRVHPRFGEESPEGLRGRAVELAARAGTTDEPAIKSAGSRLASLYDNLADFQEISEREGHHLAGVQERVGSAEIAHVAFLANDVHDFDGLRAVGRLLFEGSKGRE